MTAAEQLINFPGFPNVNVLDILRLNAYIAPRFGLLRMRMRMRVVAAAAVADGV